MQDLGLDIGNLTLYQSAVIELNWHEKARLLGVIGEAVLPAWLERCKMLKGYKLWRERPVVIESLRKCLLKEFWFYNLEEEERWRRASVGFAPELPAECPICEKAFSRGRNPRAGMMLHVYRQHEDVCKGYDCVKAYLDSILFWKKMDNILVRETLRSKYLGTAVVHEKIKTLEDFEVTFSDLMVDLAPIIGEVKTNIVGKAGRLSENQKKTRALALNWGWGWLTLNVRIGEMVTIEWVGLQMPDEDKIRCEVRNFFH